MAFSTVKEFQFIFKVVSLMVCSVVFTVKFVFVCTVFWCDLICSISDRSGVGLGICAQESLQVLRGYKC